MRLSALLVAAAFAESTCFTRFASRSRRAMARASSRMERPPSSLACCLSNSLASRSRRSMSSARPPASRSQVASITRIRVSSRGVLIEVNDSAATCSVENSTSAARVEPEPTS